MTDTTTDGDQLDIGNRQMVGSQGSHVVVLAPQAQMTPTGALVHAAWLVTVAETQLFLDGAVADGVGAFDDIRRRVENS